MNPGPSRTVVAALVALAGLAGCDERAVGLTPDGAVAAPADAAAPGCEGRGLKLRPVPLVSVERLNSFPVVRGQRFRLLARVEVRPCERLAEVFSEVDHDASTVRLVAFVWEEVGGGPSCSGSTAIAEKIMTLGFAEEGDYRVVDLMGAAEGELTLTLHPCPPGENCTCEGLPIWPGEVGDPCRFSCECNTTAPCLAYDGSLAGEGECGRSCWQDAECGPGEVCRFEVGGNYGVCRGDAQHHCPLGGCPPRFECRQSPNGSSECWANLEITPDAVIRACESDCDCSIVQRCVDYEPLGARSCLVPCEGNRDCPSGLYCGANPSSLGAFCDAHIFY